MIRFRLERKRLALLHIAEVTGRTGMWPLQRPVLFRVGWNCDEIRALHNGVLVMQSGRPIAVARNRPQP